MIRPRRPSTRALLIAYAVWMAALVYVFVLVPGIRPATWLVIGASSAGAVGLGALYHRPRRWPVWFLLSLALLVFAAGHALLLVTQLRHEYAFPSRADAVSLCMYPLILLGLLLQPRSSVRPDRAGVVDGLLLLAGVCIMLWLFVLEPLVAPAGLTGPQRLIAVLYPAGDLLIIGTSLVLFVGATRAASSVVMAVGINALLIADVLFGLSRLQSNPALLPIAWGGWVIFIVAWGAAVLVPSMAVATEPRVVPAAEFTGRRMAVLTVAAFIAPAALVIEALTNSVHDVLAVAALCAGIFALVLVRLRGVVARHRLSVHRERGLREVGTALLSAADVDAVRAALRATVAALVPPGHGHELRLLIWADDGRPPVAGGPPRIVRTAELSAELDRSVAEFGGFDIALVNPLSIEDRTGGSHLGTLVLAADDLTLRTLEPAMQVLAAQAALAIDRINLSEEIARRNSERYFRALVRNSADVILVVHDDDTIRYASPSAEAMFGDRPLIGRPVTELLPARARRSGHQLLDEVRSLSPAEGGAGELAAAWTVVGATGTREVESSVRDLRADPTVAGLVITLRDVTEPRRLERELQHRAYHDALTGLPNRLLFAELAQQAIGRAHRTSTVAGVLFIDIDDFKMVNDTMGYETGDQLLIALAARLRELSTEHDTAARLGGDEFALLIEQAPDALSIERRADRILHSLGTPIGAGTATVNTTVSIGVATTVDAANGGDLVRQADLALYLAKNAGKGRWRRYQSSLHTAMVERLALRSALDRAIAAGEFVLQYQPIVALDDGHTVGFEALVRWQHATRGLIPPSEFIGIAEESGLIVPMGAWILARSLADATAWSDSPGDGPYVSVNVSVRQFRTPGFVSAVRKELAASGIPANRLMLEITESLLLHDDEQVWLDLATLRRLGVRVAIDDFGTGYSSLSYLRQVSVDVVKIDKSFVDALDSSPQQRALVEGIVRLAHTLDLEVVAEGIERAAERDILREIGCPLGQGFLYARPMDADRVQAWLRPTVAR